MRLVDDDTVVKAGRRPLIVIGRVEDAADERLHRRNVNPVFLVRALLVETRDIEGRREFEQPLQLGVVERLLGLLSERVAIDEKENAAEALVLEQPIHQRDAGTGLAGAGRHRDQHLAAALRQRRLDRLDGFALIGPQPSIVEGLLSKAVLIGVEVLCELLLDVLGAEPFWQRARHAGGAPRIPEPNARFGRELLDERPTVGREHERNLVGGLWAMLPWAIRKDFVGAEVYAARVPFRLLQDSRHIGADLLGLDDANAPPF